MKFSLCAFELRYEVPSKGFWKDSKNAGISPREMDYGREIGETLKGWINESFSTMCDGPSSHTMTAGSDVAHWAWSLALGHSSIFI